MQGVSTKQQLLERIQAERRYWESLVTEVGESRMETPAFGGDWTFKDLATHLTAWWRCEVDHLMSIMRRQPPKPPLSPEQVEIVNQWVHAINRDRPLADVLHDAQVVWEQFESAVQALPEEDLFDPGCVAWIDGRPLGTGALDDMVGHLHEEHEPDIRAWLAAQT